MSELHTIRLPTSGPAAHGGLTHDDHALEQALRARITGEVRFDAGSRALYATDGSNYRMPPIGVSIVDRMGADLLRRWVAEMPKERRPTHVDP